MQVRLQNCSMHWQYLHNAYKTFVVPLTKGSAYSVNGIIDNGELAASVFCCNNEKWGHLCRLGDTSGRYDACSMTNVLTISLLPEAVLYRPLFYIIFQRDEAVNMFRSTDSKYLYILLKC